MSRTLEYVLGGSGWADCVLTVGEQRIQLDASYVHDTFANIVDALLAACELKTSVEWVYFHEPFSTHAVLTTTGGAYSLAIWRYPDLRVPRPALGKPGKLLAEGEVSLRKLVDDTIIAGSRMMEMHGEEGYLTSWRRPFPIASLARLKHYRRRLRAERGSI
jgi:hypothetical protein